MLPEIQYIKREEFEEAENIYKVIFHDLNNTFVMFKINGNKYYVGYPSSDIIKVRFLILEKENYLLVGVDLKVAILCLRTGSILFSLGLSSFFQGFEDRSHLSFTIFSELEDIVINKHGLSISQTIPHDLQF